MEFVREGRSAKQRTHGTQCIDRLRRSLKNFVPREIDSKSKYALNHSVI